MTSQNIDLSSKDTLCIVQNARWVQHNIKHDVLQASNIDPNQILNAVRLGTLLQV
jgi:hypothetical protein